MTIRYPKMESAVISNALGQTVKSLSFQHSSLEHIELTDLNPGLYFITVEAAGKKVSSKFIKEPRSSQAGGFLYIYIKANLEQKQDLRVIDINLKLKSYGKIPGNSGKSV